MLGATDWSNLTVAGAFILGAALATVAALRVMRVVMGSYERSLRRRRSDDDDVRD